MKLKNNKRGFAGDFILFIVIIFSFSILFVVLFFVYTQINTAWQGIDGIGSTSKNILGNFVASYAQIWDWIIVFWIFGFTIVLIIVGLALRSHPTFMTLGMIMVTIIGGMISVFLANAYDDFATSPAMAVAASNFPKANFIFSKFPHIIVLLSAVFIIVLFSKSESDLGI